MFIGTIKRPRRICNGQQIPKYIKQTFQYISLRRTLSGLFSNEIFSEKKSTDGYIYCHRDTIHFENHLFFKRFKHAIRFKLFFMTSKW